MFHFPAGLGWCLCWTLQETRSSSSMVIFPQTRVTVNSVETVFLLNLGLTKWTHGCDSRQCRFSAASQSRHSVLTSAHSLRTGSCPRFVTGKYWMSASSPRVDSNIVSLKTLPSWAPSKQRVPRILGLGLLCFVFPTSPIKSSDGHYKSQRGIIEYLHLWLQFSMSVITYDDDDESAGIIFFHSHSAVGDY